MKYFFKNYWQYLVLGFCLGIMSAAISSCSDNNEVIEKYNTYYIIDKYIPKSGNRIGEYLLLIKQNQKPYTTFCITVPENEYNSVNINDEFSLYCESNTSWPIVSVGDKSINRE